MKRILNIILLTACALVCAFPLTAQEDSSTTEASLERQRQIEEHKEAIRSLEQREAYEKARNEALEKIRRVQRIQQQIQERKSGIISRGVITPTTQNPPQGGDVKPAGQQSPKNKANEKTQNVKSVTSAKQQSASKPATSAQPKQPTKAQAATAQKQASSLKPSVVQPEKKFIAPASPILIASATPKPGKIRYVVLEKRRYLNLADIATHYRMGFRLNGRTAVLYSKNHLIVVKAKKRECFIDKTSVTLLFSAVGTNTAFYISELDYFDVIEPALNPKLPFHKVVKIMIDPGHGGTDQGAPGPTSPEKVINLQIALQLCAKLRACGFQVCMTRSTDTTVTLPQRSQMCEKEKPDLYISIHCNASTNRTISGVESWAVAPCGGQSAQETTVKTTNDPGNKFDKYNFRLAFEMQRAMLRAFPKRIDRGVKHSRFFVLRNATAPSVLLEVGFLSFYSEGKIIATPAEQAKIVSAILDGLAGYINAVK